MNRLTAALCVIAVGAYAAAAHPAQAKTLSVAPGPDAQEALQLALLDAKPGDVVALGPGRYELTDGLSLDVDDVTIKGAGPDATILSFDGQQGGAEGLLITSDRVTVRDLAVENSRGDGIKSKDADQISMINLRVEWTGGPKATNGAYGVYPVSSTHVLIDGVTVRGASDAGIYVGQSRHIIVRNSLAEFNVAGIEIENSSHADVYGNTVRHNTGGVLVFDLPNLPVMGGHSTRVFGNRIVDNDTPNFAPEGNIVASVPVGAGVMIMANRNVHVFDNEIDGNQTAAVMLVGYIQPFDDANYDPIPREVVVRDNRLGRNGWAPAFAGGAELAAAVGGALPPILWDGVAAAAGPQALRLADGPVLNLNLPAPGAMAEARPDVTPVLERGEISEPEPVVLPEAQTARVG
ncbi:parallel beta-helix domain-containing protein [Phenylobacterium sp.]|uniref:parallel beta-helix domain-containing protein n=1 Tax=Phenylobacterium sp. TaxID=1871053 RepID=UPI002FDA9A78